MRAPLPDQFLIGVLTVAPLAIAASTLWKLLGVARGAQLGRRFRENAITEPDAVDQARMLRRRHGRFELHGLLALSNALFLIWVFASDKSTDLRTDVLGLIPDQSDLFLGRLWLGLAIMLVIAIPVVEFAIWRQNRALPDPEDPVGSRLPPMRDASGIVWWTLVGWIPFLLESRSTAWKGWVLTGCILGAMVTLPMIAYCKRRARFFQMDSESSEFDLIDRIAREVGCRLRGVEVEADKRSYAHVGLFGKLVMSHGFVTRFSSADKKVLLAYEMFRAKRDDLGVVVLAIVLTLIPLLFARSLGTLAVILFLTLLVIDIFVVLPKLALRRMHRARALAADWNQSDRSVLESYLNSTPSRPWMPIP